MDLSHPIQGLSNKKAACITVVFAPCFSALACARVHCVYGPKLLYDLKVHSSSLKPTLIDGNNRLPVGAKHKFLSTYRLPLGYMR